MKFRVPKGAYFVNFGVDNVLEGSTVVEIDGSLADEKFLVNLQNAISPSIDESVRKILSDRGQEIIIRNIVRIGDVV